MKLFKYAAAVAIAILAFPVSWYLAWKSGGVCFMVLTFWLPTFGLIDFLTCHLMGVSFLQTLLSWTLALFVGTPVTMILFDFLTKGKCRW